MKKPNELTINELKTVLSEMFDEETVEEILSNYSIEQIVEIIETEREGTIDSGCTDSSKHIPSRKKESKRAKKPSTTAYKKIKTKKWQEKRRTTIPNEDTNNRSYLNKVSKGYTKLQPQVKLKKKKENKNS